MDSPVPPPAIEGDGGGRNRFLGEVEGPENQDRWSQHRNKRTGFSSQTPTPPETLLISGQHHAKRLGVE